MGYLPGQRAAGGRRRPVLMTAAAVLLAVVAAAGCGSSLPQPGGGSAGPDSPGNGNAGPGSSPPAPPAGGSQAGAGFPDESGGVTFTGSEGAVYTFSLQAGDYVLNTQASYDPANDPGGSGQCLFNGDIDYLSGSGSSTPVGVTVPITAQSPINGPPASGTLQAGDYKLFIFPETTCDWTFTIQPNN